MSYPWQYFHKHPILVLSIEWDYRMRKLGLRPDKWHWADKQLLKKTGRNDAIFT